MTEPITIEVGGKRYRIEDPANLGVEQDGWITAQLTRAGMGDPALAKLKPAAQAQEVRLRILESGQLRPLLAGFLVPEGKEWTRDGALATAKALAGPLDGEIRGLLFATLDGAIQGFFGLGSDSDAPTGKPSETAAPPEPVPASSAASSAASGNPSSAPSGDTTPSASPPVSAGTSETRSRPTSTTSRHARARSGNTK